MYKKVSHTLLGTALLAVAVVGCSKPQTTSQQRHFANDALFNTVRSNVNASDSLTIVSEIDHSRLAQEAGSVMGPAAVLIFSDPLLETALIQQHPTVALDLPLRILAFEDQETGSNKVIYNSFDYIVNRYDLDATATAGLGERYTQALRSAVAEIPNEAMDSFASDSMKPNGIITIDSPFGFQETVDKVNAAIDSQDDAMHFGAVDFQANASGQGIEIGPSLMILFGGPGPGGKAMADAPTLGLDAFCQKFLIWEDESGRVFLSFNDLLVLAERQGVKKSLALRVINFRLGKVFGDALAAGPN